MLGHRRRSRRAADAAPPVTVPGGSTVALVHTGSVTMSVRAQAMANVSVGGTSRRGGGHPARVADGWRGRLGGVVSPVEAADVSSAPTGPAAVRGRQARTELVVGVALVVAVVAVGALYARRSVAGPFDRWVLGMVPSVGGGWFSPVTWLRFPPVTVVGSLVAAAAVFRRDRPRAVACLIGPTLALVTCELVVKPAVGRTLGGVYSYPSGSTAGVAALSTVAVLATVARWRGATVVVASLVSLWMWTAVVFLHWHYPTDALAGLAYGVGVVLVTDGAAWKIAVRVGRRISAPSPPVTDRGFAPPAPPPT